MTATATARNDWARPDRNQPHWIDRGTDELLDEAVLHSMTLPISRRRPDHLALVPSTAWHESADSYQSTGDTQRYGKSSAGTLGGLARLGLLLVAAITALIVLFPSGADAEGLPPETVQYVVQSGDTLWELAAAVTPAGGSIGQTIESIKSANGLTSSMLMTGDQIELPVAR